MRVLMSADTVGGVWYYALELARGLIERDDEVLIAALGGYLSKGQRLAAAALPGLRVAESDYALEWMDRPWRDLERAGPWLLALAREFRPDIVHLNHYCHADLSWDAPVVVVAHSCVYSWHHRVKHSLPGSEWREYRRRVQRGLNAADWVVAPTASMLADASRFYGPFRGQSVIHNGRRPEEFSPGRKHPHVLSAGRLWDEAKNVTALARLAPALAWPVIVAGEARHPQGGRRNTKGLVCLGQLDASAMARAYAGAAIYALPARYEPFGLSVLEAALAGCALVLGDIPSLRELWDGCACFVEPDDPVLLEQRLQELIEQPARRAVAARRARRRAFGYTAARMTDNYRALYAHLCGAPLRIGASGQGVVACRS